MAYITSIARTAMRPLPPSPHEFDQELLNSQASGSLSVASVHP